MKKILFGLLAVVSATSVFASAVNFPIACNNSVNIDAESTLADVQKCVISKQKESKGMFVVEFKDNNAHSYTCKFATNTPTSAINSCED
ncbi:MAG: hypothetical protein EKK57_06920 [Proteobacteria bacterium]|nr:MAG: hypothetical protein EKK57_06920 [Pseudomonadota bacterium]